MKDRSTEFYEFQKRFYSIEYYPPLKLGRFKENYSNWLQRVITHFIIKLCQLYQLDSKLILDEALKLKNEQLFDLFRNDVPLFLKYQGLANVIPQKYFHVISKKHNKIIVKRKKTKKKRIKNYHTKTKRSVKAILTPMGGMPGWKRKR